MTEGQKLAELSRAVRESTLKRLRLVPAGLEDWRPGAAAMSFADVAHHLLEADAWLFRKLDDPSLASMVGSVGEAGTVNAGTLRALLSKLEQSGERRAALLDAMSSDDLERSIHDDRFGGDVTVWWAIVRGNLDHETHHRGQIASYLRTLNDRGPS